MSPSSSCASPPAMSPSAASVRRPWRALGPVALCLVILLASSATAFATEIQRISVTSAGLRVEGDSSNPFVSGDGNTVAFSSVADLTGDAETTQGVYVRTLSSPASIRRISDGYPLGLSADGQRLLAMTPAGLRIIDPQDGSIIWSTGTSNNDFYGASISANGRFVVYSDTTFPGGGGGHQHIFVHDLLTDQTEQLPDPDNNWEHPTISDDGRLVAFQPALYYESVWIYDRDTDQAYSVAVGGMSFYQAPRISPDGSKLLLNGQPDPSRTHSYVADVVVGSNSVSLANVTDLTPGEDADSAVDAWDPTGRYVSFSTADALDDVDTNGVRDIYVYDTVDHTYRLASQNADGVVGDRASGFFPPFTTSALSADAGVVVLMSRAGNLVPDDGTGVTEVTYDFRGRPIYRTDVYAAGTPSVSADTTAPLITSALLSPDLIWTLQSSQLQVEATDEGSGIAGGEYFIGADPGEGNGTPLTLDGSQLSATVPAPLAAGDYGFHVRVQDQAGNWSAVTNLTLHVQSDLLAPVVTGTPGRAPNSFGWYRLPVRILWSAVDSAPSSGSVTQPPKTWATTEGESVLYTSSPSCDAAGNCATGTFTVSLDRTDPSIVFTGAQASYTPVQTVQIACAATDALSGIATANCPSLSVRADNLPVGTNTLTASATDRAGNTRTAGVSFQVVVSTSSLQQLVDLYLPAGQPGNNGVANALKQKLANGNIGAFINQVNAQTGKRLTEQEAANLIRFALAL